MAGCRAKISQVISGQRLKLPRLTARDRSRHPLRLTGARAGLVLCDDNLKLPNLGPNHRSAHLSGDRLDDFAWGCECCSRAVLPRVFSGTGRATPRW